MLLAITYQLVLTTQMLKTIKIFKDSGLLVYLYDILIHKQYYWGSKQVSITLLCWCRKSTETTKIFHFQTNYWELKQLLVQCHKWHWPDPCTWDGKGQFCQSQWTRRQQIVLALSPVSLELCFELWLGSPCSLSQLCPECTGPPDPRHCRLAHLADHFSVTIIRINFIEKNTIIATLGKKLKQGKYPT